jgi:hypothetical protein
MKERAFATPIDRDHCIDQFVAYDKPFDPKMAQVVSLAVNLP